MLHSRGPSLGVPPPSNEPLSRHASHDMSAAHADKRRRTSYIHHHLAKRRRWRRPAHDAHGHRTPPTAHVLSVRLTTPSSPSTGTATGHLPGTGTGHRPALSPVSAISNASPPLAPSHGRAAVEPPAGGRLTPWHLSCCRSARCWRASWTFCRRRSSRRRPSPCYASLQSPPAASPSSSS